MIGLPGAKSQQRRNFDSKGHAKISSKRYPAASAPFPYGAPTTSVQTHRIGDMALRYGVPMAMHFAGTPVSCMASVHCAAATRNFLALENHSLDVPWWQDLVTGFDKAIINQGYIKVPDTPGLGVELNDDELKEHLKPGTGYFEPTPMWDDALFS